MNTPTQATPEIRPNSNPAADAKYALAQQGQAARDDIARRGDDVTGAGRNDGR